MSRHSAVVLSRSGVGVSRFRRSVVDRSVLSLVLSELLGLWALQTRERSRLPWWLRFVCGSVSEAVIGWWNGGAVSELQDVKQCCGVSNSGIAF